MQRGNLLSLRGKTVYYLASAAGFGAHPLFSNFILFPPFFRRSVWEQNGGYRRYEQIGMIIEQFRGFFESARRGAHQTSA